MNALFAQNLALLLFLPWFLILAALFWLFPRQPRGHVRRGFDLASLAIATAAAVIGMHWSIEHAVTTHGALWKQLLATLVAYGLFLGVMTLAVLLRARMFRRSGRRSP